MKKYLEIEETDNANKLEIEVYYSLGGMNYFTGSNEQRGYYLSVTPVKREREWVTTTAFTGIKALLLPVTRKSDKAYEQACELAKSKEQELIDYVCAKNGIKLKSQETV